jgi:aspartyl-tRNA(Asn)/glutamyl-tRNA(Gln) amidotransferase subunit C
MDRISREEIKHVARLAELEFSEEQISKLAPQLDRILEHVARIGAVNTENVAPTAHAVKMNNVFREDVPRDSVPHKVAVKNAPRQEEGGFKVPRID